MIPWNVGCEGDQQMWARDSAPRVGPGLEAVPRPEGEPRRASLARMHTPVLGLAPCRFGLWRPGGVETLPVGWSGDSPGGVLQLLLVWGAGV